MKIYLNAQYKCVKVEDNTFVANSTSNFIRYYFVQNADGTLADEITESTEVYLNQEPSYVTLGFRRADGNTIQHLMATPKTEGTEAFWEYVITETDGVLYKKGALEVSAQFINATLNSENKIISQKVMAVAINTAHILDNIGEEAEEYYSQYEQANNEAHAELQAQITEKFNNIGVMGSLTTDNKNTLVEAINEVDEHVDKAQNYVNKLSDDIGDKLSLTTDEKNTIVGAINEVDEHADTAQTTADSAIQTANNAKTVADTAKSIADSASQTANAAKTTANNASATANAIAGTANQAMTIAEQAKTIATNSVYSVSFEDIQSAVTALNGYDNAYFKVGNSIYLKQKDVPDMWVYAVASEYVEYTYTTDDDFVNALLLGTVQVGYYVLANLESTGDYDVLKNKPIINQDLSADGFTPVENTYYRHTGTTLETYTAGVIYFYNGTAYKAIDGAGGETPTSLPVTYKKASGNLPISGWSTLDEGWKANTLPASRKWTSVTYGDGKYVAVAENSSAGAYSTDGVSWTEMVLPASRSWNSIAYGNGKFVAIALNSDKGAYSTDGITWTETVLSASRLWNSVTYGDGKFVMLVTNAAVGAYSTNGINWTEFALPASRSWSSVTYGNDKFVAVAGSSGGKGAYSTDGITWTEMTMPGSWWSSVTYGNGKFVAVSDNDNDKGAYSTDGIVWAETTVSTTSRSWYVTYGGGKFVAVASGSAKGAYSTDGINWTEFTLSASSSWRSVTYGDGKFVAVAYNSANGAYWKSAAQVTYSISDTFITANTAVKMYLTDEGGVKAQSKANGSITVIRDTVPTTAIPYEYEVEQTSDEGLFEVVNAYVPTIPETPTALPQTAGALKSGELQPANWVSDTVLPYWEGLIACSYNEYTLITNNIKFANKCYLPTDTIVTKSSTTGWQDVNYRNFIYIKDVIINGETARQYDYYSGYGSEICVTASGKIYGKGLLSKERPLWVAELGFTDETTYIYTISNTDITENSDVLMELTDEGGTYAYTRENGSITLKRYNLPTTVIPYTYKVKQTNASGQFTVLNHYTPNVPNTIVESVNGQTGAVTIAVPTKTSQLENDSGYVSSIPIVQNVVCNDVDSATTLDTTITCEIGDLILAQIIVRSALTLPTGWTLLRTIPAVETSVNQTLSFAYKRATSTSETLTVTQATAARIYTNIVRLSNVGSISYIQSCEKTGTSIKSISSTKPVTPNMVIWGASADTWKTSSPYGDWVYSPSTLDYYSLPQASRQPRLGTFVDSSGAGERTFTIPVNNTDGIMCGAVEIVGDEVARKGDIPSVTTLYEDSTGAATVTLSETINNGDIVRIKTNNGNVDHYFIGVAWNRAITVTESFMVTDESNVTVGTAINIDSLRFNIQDTSLILFHYFNTNITTAGAVTITNEKANVVIRKVERIHT